MPGPADLDLLVARLQRLDARRVKQAPGQLALGLEVPAGRGVPCGESFIAPEKVCRKGAAAAPPTAAPPAPAAKGPSPRVLAFLAGAEERKRLREQAVAAAREKLAGPGGPGLLIELGEGGEPQIGGRGPAKRLGGGAFGDTFLFDLEDGTQAVVKVDRPGNTDPLNRDMQLTGENERMLMAQRELGMLGAAAELGISPRPLSQGVSRLSDGRFAFAYEFAPGSTLCPDHTTNMLTDGAMATLQKPGAMARFAEGLAKIARAAATAGLDHRDEHGGNLLVLEDGTPQLLDWAMARRQPTDPTHQGAIEAGMVRTFGDIAGVTRIAPGHKPAIAEFLSHAAHDAFRAQYADVDILEEWMMEQPDKKEQRTKEKIKMANAIQKAHPYRNFFWAEVDAGIIPHPDPETMAAAQAAKDKVFGADHLRRMRRTIDQHMARGRSRQ